MRALALAGWIALAGCSWDPEQPNVTVHVNGIPTDPAAGVDHLNVTVTDSSNSPKQYRPTFQPGSLAYDIYGHPLKDPKGKTKDYGFQFIMLGGRLSIDCGPCRGRNGHGGCLAPDVYR